MFEMCVKCGYMYEDNGTGCPECKKNAKVEPVVQAPVFNNVPVIDPWAEERRRAEEERLAREAEERRITEEERLAREAEAFRIAEEERLAREAEAFRLAEEERLAREAEERRIAEEAEAFRIAEEERLAREAEAFRLAEEERLAREAEERRIAEEAEAFRRAEEERLAREAEVISITYSHILRREKTNECIFINKNGFVIGRSETRADYIIVDNPSISRVHSTLYIDGSHCYISDNNSLNKTFVNGRMLNENECIELKNGDTIDVYNERFVYFLN